MQAQPTFSEWEGVLQHRHNLLHGKMGVEIKGISQKLEDRSPALRFHRTQYNNRLHGAEIKINVSSRSAEKADIERAQRVENFYYAIYHDLTRPTGDNAERGTIDQMVSYGVGVPNLDFAPHVREDIFGKNKHLRDVDDLRAVLPDIGFTKNPFVLRAPALSTVYWPPDRSTFCEIGEQTVSQLRLVYEENEPVGKWLTSFTMPEGGSDYDTLATVYHLETAEYIYDVVEGGDQEDLMVEYRPNVAGRPWYTLMAGHENSEISVSEKYEPLIGPLYAVVQLLNITGTLIMSGALQTGRNVYQLVKDGSRGAENFLDYQQMPANQRPALHSLAADEAVVTPPPGYHYEPFPVPDQEQLIRAHQMNEDKLERWGFPASLSTDAPLQADATSGYHAARQMEAASDYLEPALRSRARSWRERFQLVADILQTLQVSVTIPVHLRAQGGSTKVQEMVKVKPDDFKEHNLDVTFLSVPATVKHSMRESDLRLVQGIPELGPLMSLATFFELHYENPVEEQKKIDLQRVRQPIRDMALAAALAEVQRSAGALTEQAAAEAEIPLPAIAPGPEGGPPEPGGIRNERPPEGSAAPGLGAANVVAEQPIPAGGMPPSMGTETAAGAP